MPLNEGENAKGAEMWLAGGVSSWLANVGLFLPKRMLCRAKIFIILEKWMHNEEAKCYKMLGEIRALNSHCLRCWLSYETKKTPKNKKPSRRDCGVFGH